MKTIIARARLLIIVLSLMVGVTISTSTDEAAAHGALFSHIHNESPYALWIGRNWETKSPARWLNPGGSTAWNEDWDGFRVDAGWCYRFVVETYWPPPRPTDVTGYRIDRRGLGEYWFQVHDNQTARIFTQTTSAC